MTKQEITDKIHEILCNKFSIDKKEITPGSTLNSLGADSLDLVEVIDDIEKIFIIIIPDNKAFKFNTIESVVDYIDNIINKK